MRSTYALHLPLWPSISYIYHCACFYCNSISSKAPFYPCFFSSPKQINPSIILPIQPHLTIPRCNIFSALLSPSISVSNLSLCLFSPSHPHTRTHTHMHSQSTFGAVYQAASRFYQIYLYPLPDAITVSVFRLTPLSPLKKDATSWVLCIN